MNDFLCGIVFGFSCTILLEIVGILVYANSKGGKK
jgi:hypothetical protein